MNFEETKVQIKILIEILNKKIKILDQIYAIAENQYEVIDLNESDMNYFDQMNIEKKIKIDEINELDEHFLNLYKNISLLIQSNSKECKELIEELKKQILVISDIDIKIKIQEEKNRQRLISRFNNKSRIFNKSLKGSMQVSQSYKEHTKFTKRNN